MILELSLDLPGLEANDVSVNYEDGTVSVAEGEAAKARTVEVKTT